MMTPQYCLTTFPFSNSVQPPSPINDIMDLHMSSLGTLVPGLRCVFYATSYQVYEGLTHNEVFTPIHKKRNTAHSGTNRLTHPYKHILTLPVVCTQQLSVSH